MPFDNVTQAQIYQYKFDVPIKSPAEKVWTLMTDEINSWWMNDFRALGEQSVVSLSAETGGLLVERNDNGDCLEWYRVQMCQPQKALYLIGYMAPDWGRADVVNVKTSDRGERRRLRPHSFGCAHGQC